MRNISNFDISNFTIYEKTESFLTPECVGWCQDQVDNLFKYFNSEQSVLLYLIGFVLVISFFISTFSRYLPEKQKETMLKVYVYCNDFAMYMTLALLIWFLWF